VPAVTAAARMERVRKRMFPHSRRDADASAGPAASCCGCTVNGLPLDRVTSKTVGRAPPLEDGSPLPSCSQLGRMLSGSGRKGAKLQQHETQRQRDHVERSGPGQGGTRRSTAAVSYE